MAHQPVVQQRQQRSCTKILFISFLFFLSLEIYVWVGWGRESKTAEMHSQGRDTNLKWTASSSFCFRKNGTGPPQGIKSFLFLLASLVSRVWHRGISRHRIILVSSCFSTKLVATPRLKSSVCPTILPIAGGGIIGFIPFQRHLRNVKCKQPRPGFEHGLPCLFPKTVSIIPRTPSIYKSDHTCTHTHTLTYTHTHTHTYIYIYIYKEIYIYIRASSYI